MRMRKVLFVAVMTLAATGADAQVFKCKQGEAVVFTDKPCIDGGAPLKSLPRGPQSSLDFQLLTRHYQVSAPNLASAVRTIRARTPGGFWGWARWNVGYKYDSVESPAGCTLSSVTVRMVGDIEMPEWVDEPSASQRDREYWRSMYASLRKHEDGHIQNGREFALLLKERLLGIGTVPCAEVPVRAAREYKILYGNLQRRDEEYDRRTDHGLRQDNPE